MCTVTVESRGRGRSGKFAPTSCGTLLLNDGAEAFDADIDPPLLIGTSNSLCLATVEDLSNSDTGNPGGPDGSIAADGTGDEDLDGFTDFDEACVFGSDPCVFDTDLDQDEVPDSVDPNTADPCIPDPESPACN